MPKCNKCGSFMSQDEIFCPKCRTKRKKSVSDTLNDTLKNLGNTADYTSAYSANDINENKIFAVISYIPFICLFPVFVSSKKSAFTKFHANQGLVLFIAELLISLVMWLVGFVLGLIPFAAAILAFPLSILSWAIELLEFAAIVYGIYIAATGKAKELPVIGKIKILK